MEKWQQSNNNALFRHFFIPSMNTIPSLEHIIDTISTLYKPLTVECKRDVVQVSRVQRFEKSTFLVKEGQYSDKLYFIVSGAARAFYVKGDKDVTDWFSFENEFISALNSYFQNIPSPHYIELLEPSVVWEISRADASRLSEIHPCFEMLGKSSILKTLLELHAHVVAIQFESARQRYDNLLAIRPDITCRVPLHNIASFLGITMETLSRIRNPKNGKILHEA